MSIAERTPLTRERVASAALDLIDEQGLDALSMRKLGASVGVEAMSLYNHVANKDDLLVAVTDRLYGEILASYGEPEGDWRVMARAMCRAYVQVADAHPNSLPLLVDRPVDAAGGIEFISRIVSMFDGSVDDMRTGVLAFSVASNWVIGTIIQEHGLLARLRAEGEGVTVEDIPDEFEPLLRFRDAVVRDLTPEDRFEEGLEAILDGIEARFFRT